MAQNSNLKDNQDIFDLNINQFVSLLISPIDKIRSQTENDGFIEARIDAFYRMIGFPVVASDNNFYTPGYDLDLNLDIKNKEKQNTINNSILKNIKLATQLEKRRSKFISNRTIYSQSELGVALSIGSIFIRAFNKQINGSNPLELDKGQDQIIPQRDSELYDYYNNNDTQSQYFSAIQQNNYLKSNHIIKPFIVNPLTKITPDINIMAAPFVSDASKLQNFNSSSYKRPYIEKVILSRFNNQNKSNTSPNVNQILSDIKNNKTVIDAYLVNVSNNPMAEIQGSPIKVFDTYFRLIQALLIKLTDSIKETIDIRHQINFRPIIDNKLGLEGNVKLDNVSDNANNTQYENDILTLNQKKILKSFQFGSNFGLNGKVDVGNFAFSGLDDIVFSSDKVAEPTAIDDQLKELVQRRNALGAHGIENLQNIEYIMGEFSGLGMIDIVATQAAFWLMAPDKLLGLVDERIFNRITQNAQSLNLSGLSRDASIFNCLQEFETKLKDIYELTQLYFDQIYNGKAEVIN